MLWVVIPFQCLRVHWLFAWEGVGTLFLLLSVTLVPMLLCGLVECLSFCLLDGVICDPDNLLFVPCLATFLLL